MPLASLAAQGFGIHRQVIFVHAQTLEKAIFKMKLSNKVTGEAYHHYKQFPIHGTGQGSGNSPVIWCFISSELFQCYEYGAHGMTFSTPDGSVTFSMAIVGFVDDTTCITSGGPTQPLSHVLQQMQDFPQLWNDLLKGVVDGIVSSGATPSKARLFYDSVYRPAIKCTLPQSFLSPKQLSDIEKKTLPRLYARCGFNQNTSRAILQGPADLGGAGFTPLKTVSGSGYIAHFLKKICSPQEDVGKLVRTMLAWTQYQSGLSHPILKHPWTPIHFVESRYYHFLMIYLDEINGSINYSPFYTQPKLQSNDQAIMEIALESDSFTVIELRRINCVRMYLGFTYISELCNPHGRSCHPTILSRTQDAGQYRTTLSSPHQPKPNTCSWILWECVFHLITQSDNKTLKYPLGPWTNHHSMAGRWQSYQLHDTVFDFVPATACWN
mmetsp:Transcript_22813/g.50924  ORF Transcript_22813/g.50924 Transcript_22813/m.50924 type:complete len:438 (-) Transcript_22813:647-1960(-)